MDKTVREFIRGMLARPEGRAFFAWLIFDFGQVMTSAFTQNALTTAFNEGKKDQARFLWATLESEFPAELAALIRERAERNDNGRRRTRTKPDSAR